MSVFALPDLGEGLQDAEVVAWHVAAGDHVVADQPLLAVETDKAVVEVPSPRSGRILRLCAETGARVKVGAPLVEFEEGAHADSGTVVGELPGAPPEIHPPPRPAAPSAARKASPAARALAARAGVDLASVPATGPDGTITREDVEGAVAAAGPAGAPEALRGMRRAMALNLGGGGPAVVPATVSEDADIGDWDPAADVSVRLIRALVAGCAASPALNAWYDAARAERRVHARVDLGVAVDTDDGLIVPVLRDVGASSAADLRRRLDALEAEARARKLPLAALRGATITLSNFGTIAGRYAALAIAPPQVAILGAGRARDAIVPRAGAPATRRVLPLSLTFDHRVVTGGEAARLLAAAIADLERPG